MVYNILVPGKVCARGHSVFCSECWAGSPSTAHIAYNTGHTPMFWHPTCTCMCRHPYVLTPLCADTPMFDQPYVVTALCSDTSIFWHPLCSDSPMFRHPYEPTPQCSDTPMFQQRYVLSLLCFGRPQTPYVPPSLCCHAPLHVCSDNYCKKGNPVSAPGVGGNGLSGKK